MEQSICWVSVLKVRKVAEKMAVIKRMQRKGKQVRVSRTCCRYGALPVLPCSALRLGGVGGLALWSRDALQGQKAYTA